MKRIPYKMQPEARCERWLFDLPMWKALGQVQRRGDTLMYRWLALRSHGNETLINIIRGHHGLPNAY